MTVSTSTTLESLLNGAHARWRPPACHRGRRVALLMESTHPLHVSSTFLIPASPQGTALARQAGLVSNATSPTLALFQCGVLTLLVAKVEMFVVFLPRARLPPSPAFVLPPFKSVFQSQSRPNAFSPWALSLACAQVTEMDYRRPDPVPHSPSLPPSVFSTLFPRFSAG